MTAAGVLVAKILVAASIAGACSVAESWLKSKSR